jgi:hypothetical protein
MPPDMTSSGGAGGPLSWFEKAREFRAVGNGTDAVPYSD